MITHLNNKLFGRLAVFIIAVTLVGCGKAENSADSLDQTAQSTAIPGEGKESVKKGGLEYETAGDGHIDFDALRAENPDIFGWLYVPGTNIDFPVLQSPESDEYYKTHIESGEEGENGALYTEMPNMMNMCDFNTIIHGKDETETDLFFELHKFENPDFFKENNNFYIYLPDNVLTYEIVVSYYDDESDILRRYDYTTYDGCSSHLDDIYNMRDMSKNMRSGWENITPGHFLVTLNGGIDGETGKQYVVIGVLVGDAADHIDRMILN